MRFDRNEDPRDALTRIRRKPIENFFKVKFPSMWQAGMPAELMRIIMRQHGIHNIPDAPRHVMGEAPKMAPISLPDAPPTQAEIDNAMDATELLKRQWESSQKQTFTADTDINILRKACKANGIKLSRRDRREDMARKLNGENAS